MQRRGFSSCEGGRPADTAIRGKIRRPGDGDAAVDPAIPAAQKGTDVVMPDSVLQIRKGNVKFERAGRGRNIQAEAAVQRIRYGLHAGGQIPGPCARQISEVERADLFPAGYRDRL